MIARTTTKRTVRLFLRLKSINYAFIQITTQYINPIVYMDTYTSQGGAWMITKNAKNVKYNTIRPATQPTPKKPPSRENHKPAMSGLWRFLGYLRFFFLF